MAVPFKIDNSGRSLSWEWFLANAKERILQVGTHRGQRCRKDAVIVDKYDPAADLMEDIMALEQMAQFGSCCCHAILEHVPDYGLALDSIHYCLTPGAMIHVEVPWNQPLHYEGEWRDYWRFSVFGLRVALENHGFEVTHIGWFGEPDYASVYAMGVRI